MSILKELYYGNIRPTDEPQSVEVRKALSEVTEIEEADTGNGCWLHSFMQLFTIFQHK